MGFSVSVCVCVCLCLWREGAHTFLAVKSVCNIVQAYCVDVFMECSSMRWQIWFVSFSWCIWFFFLKSSMLYDKRSAQYKTIHQWVNESAEFGLMWQRSPANATYPFLMRHAFGAAAFYTVLYRDNRQHIGHVTCRWIHDTPFFAEPASSIASFTSKR